MQVFASIAPDLAHEALSYDEGTGLLRWRERVGTSGPVRSFNSRFAGKAAGHRHTCTVGKTYVQVRVAGHLHYAHRIAWVMMHGPIAPGMQVDHIDGDGANNKAANLRLVTDRENKRNQRRMVSNTSGYTGVYLDKRRGTYAARVWEEGRFRSLGSAATAEEAYVIRQRYNRQNGYHENHGTDRPL